MSSAFLLGRDAGLDLPDRTASKMPSTYFTEDLPVALGQAVSILGPRYDAIVVDEGQDFEEMWWIPLTELLRDQTQGILYIFFDDRQAIYAQSKALLISSEKVPTLRLKRDSGALAA
jgi:hypothetical protein